MIEGSGHLLERRITSTLSSPLLLHIILILRLAEHFDTGQDADAE
jgi:hypothetical protein